MISDIHENLCKIKVKPPIVELVINVENTYLIQIQRELSKFEKKYEWAELYMDEMSHNTPFVSCQ